MLETKIIRLIGIANHSRRRELLREMHIVPLRNWHEFENFAFFSSLSHFFFYQVSKKGKEVEMLNGGDPEGKVKGSDGKLKYS